MKTPPPRPTRRNGSTNANQKKSDAIIQITNTPTPAKWPGHYTCLVLDCNKQAQYQTDGYCMAHYNQIIKGKKSQIEVVFETSPTTTAAAKYKKRKQSRTNNADSSDEDSSNSLSTTTTTTTKKSKLQKQQRRQRPQLPRQQQLATTNRETRNRKLRTQSPTPRRRVKSRPVVYTEHDDSEFDDNDDEDMDDDDEDAEKITTLNSRRKEKTQQRPSREQQLQQKNEYNRRRMRMSRGQDDDDDDDDEVLEENKDEDVKDDEVLFISSSPGRSRRSNNDRAGGHSNRRKSSSRQQEQQQLKKRKLDSKNNSTSLPIKKMRRTDDSNHTVTTRGSNNNSGRKSGNSTRNRMNNDTIGSSCINGRNNNNNNNSSLSPFDIKPSESLLLSSKKEEGKGRLRLRNKNNTERILLERTRHELLTGRDYWICTTCIKSVPSLTLTCEHCNQLILFVPLTMNELTRFVHRQRLIGNTSYTATTTFPRDEEVDESSMAIQSSMGVETVTISQTEQEQTSLSSCKKLQIKNEEQGFMMESTSPIIGASIPEQSNRITEGSLVVVQARTWSGMNKLGGVGRVIKVHNTAADDNETNNVTKYDVAYVLGGRESYVDASFVTFYTDTD